MNPSASVITPDSTMQAVLEAFPGARRTLFRQYHIGGCSSCGFQSEETLAQVCARNNLPAVAPVLESIRSGQEQDEQVLIAPAGLAAWLKAEKPPRLLDIRTREEWDVVRIEGATLMGQDVMQEILSRWSRTDGLVIYDHEGKQSLDAAAYFLGHGFQQVRCLRGGIDAWAQQVEPALPRYRLE